MRTLSLFLSATLSIGAGIAAQPQLLVPQTTPSTRTAAPSTTMGTECGTDEVTIQARAFRVPQLSGNKLAKAVNKVLALRWHKNLKTAAKAARAQDKPLVWIQTLGDLRGRT